MSIDPETLSQDWLFVSRPPPHDISLQEFHDSMESNDLASLIDNTFNVLKLPLTVADKLKTWEIRLSLQLFNNNLQQAKQEAINLNNLLYLQENNNVAPSNPGVYPLPRNNNGLIHHQLLVLLLRLKSVPNMNLINEFYKLCYQLRLRGSNHDDYNELSRKLLNLSFDTTVILLNNNYYPTVLNFLNSIIYEIKSNKIQDYNSLLGNITLMKIITKIFVYKSTQSDANIIIDNIVNDHQQEFQQIPVDSINCLILAMSHQVKHSIDITHDSLSLSKLVELIMNGEISSKTLSSTIAIWDLVNTFEFELQDNRLVATGDIVDEISVSNCLQHVCKRWCSNFDKLYGLV